MASKALQYCFRCYLQSPSKSAPRCLHVYKMLLQNLFKGCSKDIKGVLQNASQVCSNCLKGLLKTVSKDCPCQEEMLHRSADVLYWTKLFSTDLSFNGSKKMSSTVQNFVTTDLILNASTSPKNPTTNPSYNRFKFFHRSTNSFYKQKTPQF